jgi:hypothetical protein
MKKIFFLLLFAIAAWKLFDGPGSVSLGPGVMAGAVPYQETLDTPVNRRFDDYTVTDLARFNIKAKVLARKDYSIGRESDLSPVDLALGWGNMSDESVLEQIEISQSGRFYRWQVESFPIPRREIETHSANMHLIPASDAVESELQKVKEGEIVEISGSLEVRADDGWNWRSSLTRDDTGAGACELILVESFRIVTF